MVPSAPYIIDCDALATDYSTIMFDGYLLGKPCALYCPDRDEYLRDRGMYWLHLTTTMLTVTITVRIYTPAVPATAAASMPKVPISTYQPVSLP